MRYSLGTTTQTLKAAALLAGGLAVSAPAYADIIPIDFSAFHNSRMQTYSGAAGSYPSGNVTLGGVDFSIPNTGNNVWNASVAGGANPRQIDIPVNLYGVDRIYTLINTWWGEQSVGTFASLRFLGSAGADYTISLDGNSDIRDYLNGSYTNSINGTTTINAFTAGSGGGNQVRLDMQNIDLPTAFLSQILTTIRVSDTGSDGFQRVFLAGVTANTAAVVPEPASLGLVGGGLALMLGLRRARRRMSMYVEASKSI